MENNMMNRPVTAADIAARLNMSVATVRIAMSDKSSAIVGLSQKTVARVRETAKQMGYNPKAAMIYGAWYYDGNFKTKEEEVSRMLELRGQGYSNAEIAAKVGRSYLTVLGAIGKQDEELSRQNRSMGQHIRAQKAAARRQYVINKPIREHNAKVAAAQKKQAEIEAALAKLAEEQAAIKAEQPAIEQVAQTKIEFPLFDLHTVQPTALQ